MYNLVKTVSLHRSTGAQWEERDLANILVFDIFNTYSKCYLELTDTVTNFTLLVDLESLRTEFSSYEGTLSEIIVLLDGRVLETVSEIPSSLVRYVRYSDAIRGGYKIGITNMDIVVPANYPPGDLHDAVLTRPDHGTDMSLLDSHCLVSINGYIHPTVSDATHTYIRHGADTLRESRVNHVGITSFLDVAPLTKVDIDVSTIRSIDANNPLSDKIYFDIPNDLDNKSFILVLGGYMVFPEDTTFWRSGTNTFALDINKIPYLERLIESDLYMDLGALGLSVSPTVDSLIDTTEALSDTVLKNYLTMDQSFLVIVDTPNLTKENIGVRHSGLPGMFTVYQDPTIPLVTNYGKLAEYWKTYEDGQWSVTVEDKFLRNYILSEQPVEQIVNTNLLSNKQFQQTQGFLLNLFSY